MPEFKMTKFPGTIKKHVIVSVPRPQPDCEKFFLTGLILFLRIISRKTHVQKLFRQFLCF